MIRNEVFEDLRDFLADMLDASPSGFSESSRIWADLEVDSLSILELAVHCEDKYGVDLEPILNDSGRDDLTIGWIVNRVVEGQVHLP